MRRFHHSRDTKTPHDKDFRHKHGAKRLTAGLSGTRASRNASRQRFQAHALAEMPHGKGNRHADARRPPFLHGAAPGFAFAMRFPSSRDPISPRKRKNRCRRGTWRHHKRKNRCQQSARRLRKRKNRCRQSARGAARMRTTPHRPVSHFLDTKSTTQTPRAHKRRIAIRR